MQENNTECPSTAGSHMTTKSYGAYLLFTGNTSICSMINWMLQKGTLSGRVPFFQVHLYIAVGNIRGEEKRHLENSVYRSHK